MALLQHKNVVNFTGTMKINSALQKLGLTYKEIEIYLAALELGSASVQKIAQKAALVRSTVYEVLEKLRGKGLVTTYLKKRVRYYSAEDPGQMVCWAENQVTALKDALPELNALAGKSRRRPTVRFYEGKDGIRAVLQEILDEARDILAFGSAAELFQEISDFPTFFVRERIKRKIPIKVILRDSPKARERQKLGPRELREVRIVLHTYPYQGIIYIWRDKMVMISLTTDFIAVVTESRELTDTQRALFMNMWDKLENRETVQV